MGKFLVILVLAASAAGLHHALSVNGSVREATVQSSLQGQEVLARTAALTGWARAKHALMTSFTSTTITGSNDGTAYETTVAVTGDRALIISVGRIPRLGRSGETTYRIAYNVRRNLLKPRPPYMNYAITAGGDATFSGSADLVRNGITDATRDTSMVAVHTNSSLSAGNGTTLNAFGRYVGTVTGTGNFRPAYNPLGLPTTQRVPPIEIPPVIPDSIISREGGADVTYAGSNVTISGVTLAGGTRDNPRVYHFLSNVTLDNVTVNGYAVFVANNNFSITGTVRGLPDSYMGPQESSIALYTNNNLHMGSNSILYAQVFARQSVKFGGSSDVYGTITVNGKYDQGGSSRVHYRPASAGLTQGLTGRPDPGMTLLAVREQ